MKRASVFLAGLIVILSSLVASMYCEAAEPVVAAVEIDYPAEVPAGVKELILVKPGEPLSAKKVRDSIKLLWLKGIFQDIVVEGKDTPSGVVLIYHLIPRIRVDNVRVKGNHEISKKKIINRIALKEGDFIDESLMEKSKAEIKKLYDEEGFRKASAEIAVQKKNPLEADLVVVIKEGPPTIISKITFSGDTGLPEEDLRKKLKIKEGREYNKEKVDSTVDALDGYLLKENFVAADVNSPNETFTDDKVALNFSIDAGPRLALQFEGNKNISDKKLKKQLTFWEDRDISDEAVSENLDKLIDYYKKEGYYFATASSRTEESENPPTVTIRFLINEGPRVQLDKIKISGNHAVKTNEIKDVMDLQESGIFRKTRITKDAIDQDIERIKAFYESKGFQKAEVKAGDLVFSQDRTKADLPIVIDEGPKTIISSIDFKGNSQIGTDKLRAAITEKTGDPFSPQQEKDDQNSVLSTYSQKGFVHATVDSENKFSEDYTKAQVVFNISEGMEERAGRIILRGNEQAKDKVVLRELLIKTGDPLDYEKILKSQQRIYKLGFFSQVKIQPVEPEKVQPVKDLLVTVKERDAGAVEVGAGYGDYDRYRGFAEVSYKDLWGLGHRISLRGEMSTKEGKALLTYRWPWFMDRALDYRTSLVYLDSHKPSYHIIDFILNTGFDKSFGDHITTSLAYQYEKVKLGAIRPGAVLAPEDQRKSSLASISPSAIFDYRDNPFNPTRGSMYAAIVKGAFKYIGSTVNMLKMTAQGSWYIPIYKKIIFGFSARGGIAGWPSGPFNVPISERFFLGGASSLRGYTYESVAPTAKDGTPAGGDSMALFNTEVRFPLPYSFGFVTFLDAGNVWLIHKPEEGFVQTGTNGLRYGAGVGLRYDTPVGPLRLDYGIKLNPLPGESRGVLHFTLGQAF